MQPLLLSLFLFFPASVLSDISLEVAMQRVIHHLPEDPIDDDSDDDENADNTANNNATNKDDNSYGEIGIKMNNSNDNTTDNGDKDIIEKIQEISISISEETIFPPSQPITNNIENKITYSNNTSITGDNKVTKKNATSNKLITLNSERSLVSFHSPAAEYFNNRDFQGQFVYLFVCLFVYLYFLFHNGFVIHIE